MAGVGHLGSLHARIYAGLPGAELAGVFDLDRELAREVAARHGVRAFSSLEELAAEAEAVSLAVPTDAHHELGCALLKAGCHLLVEKPIAASIAQAAELVALAEERALVLQVGHVERFNPALLSAAGQLDGVLYLESERLAPFNPRGTEVPVVLDLMIHDIDIILSIVRRRVLTVAALGLPVFTSSVDIANARLEFEGGAVASVSASRASMEKVRKMRFFAPDRYLSVDLLQRGVQLYRKRPGASPSLDRRAANPGPASMLELVSREELPVDTTREPLAMELESFLSCVSGGLPPVVSGRDGLQALEVAERIMEAIGRSLEQAGLAAPRPLAGKEAVS